MGFALNSFGKPVYTDAADPVPDFQAAVDFAYLFAYVRSGTAADRGNLVAGQLRDGMQFFETDTSITYRRIAGAWKPWDSDWITYTPTTTITVGSGGTSEVRYRYESGRCRVKGYYKLGSSGGSIATGATITLPITRAALIHTYQASPELGAYFDSSTGFAYRFNIHSFGTSTTVVAFLMGLQPVTTAVAGGNPVALGVDDVIYFDFTIDPA